MFNEKDVLSKPKSNLVLFVENLTNETPNVNEIVYNEKKLRVEMLLEYKQNTIKVAVLLKHPHVINISFSLNKEGKYISRYLFPATPQCIDTALCKLRYALEFSKN